MSGGRTAIHQTPRRSGSTPRRARARAAAAMLAGLIVAGAAVIFSVMVFRQGLRPLTTTAAQPTQHARDLGRAGLLRPAVPNAHQVTGQ